MSGTYNLQVVKLNKPLKVAMVESEKSQLEIAELAGIHYTRLSHIVRGRVRPSASEKERIAGVLQRPIAELFVEEAVA